MHGFTDVCRYVRFFFCLLYRSLWLAGWCFFFFQAEDGIRYLVRSRGLGDVYKRQLYVLSRDPVTNSSPGQVLSVDSELFREVANQWGSCLLYTSDAADERSSVDLGGRRIIKKKTSTVNTTCALDI